MSRMSLGLMLAASLGLSGPWTGGGRESFPAPWSAQAESQATGPREPWLRGDPADSIYRAARASLDQRDYRRAADLFSQITERFPRSGYAADAYYWRAFALYRLGGSAQLRDALQALDRQRERFPQAATRGDASALERRIQGELARRGDVQAATNVAEAAEAAGAPQPPAPPAPPSARERPHRGCDDDEDDTKLAALNALQQMDDERARPILRRVLARRDPGSVCLRRKAVFLIAQEEANGAEDILLETARIDPDREVREQAVFWLSQVGSDRAVNALDSIVRTSKESSLQEKAVFALSQQDSPRARQALRTYPERADLPSETRERAIFWIGQSGGQENDAFLRGLFGRLKDEELRKKVLFSVSQSEGAENGRWLLGVARDAAEPIELRKQALFWAGQGGAAINDLIGLYANTTDPRMREQLLFVYSQRDETAAVDKLIEIGRRDPNPELRKKAIFWLGQSDDPRAAKALQDVIEQP